MSVAAKPRWRFEDITRWAQRYCVLFAFNPHFPINPLTLMRGAVGLQLRQPALFTRYVDAVFNALWAEPHDLKQPHPVAAVLAPLGITPDAFMALVGDAEVKAALSVSTEEAVARGVFGAPTCFVGEAMFFGQHRLDFVRDALTTA